MSREYRVMIEQDLDDGGYTVWVPVLPGCVSQGESLEEALANIREAIQCWEESALKHGEELPDESAMTEVTVPV